MPVCWPNWTQIYSYIKTTQKNLKAIKVSVFVVFLVSSWSQLKNKVK